ncbi:hypothetical protein P171DRAFT_486936 [Karstenula rhodostoma CBS 690.94]|uniref:Uncharacterized protein n=1 Tax=Karstenula rhodostoma CBS 690.94 TaxID=1392251 RepID=A0A9P4UBC2_9PLEO|nr:hypothetical protein P171DRAFT_486936 [Karstenula rhodostoma CBS 690.94]
MSLPLPETPKTTTFPTIGTPTSAKVPLVHSPLNASKRDIWTAHQLEQFDAAHVLFPSAGDDSIGASSYTIRDFINEAVEFLSPNYSTRQKSSISKSMRKQYEFLLVDLEAPIPSSWTEALENDNIKDALSYFLKNFAKVAYAKTLTTHRTSIRTIFNACQNLIQQHISPSETLPIQVSPFSMTSTPASKVSGIFDSSSPLQHRTPFTPFFTPLTLKMDPEFGYPLTPEDDAIQFFDRILESRTQSIINAEFKLEYLDKQCAKKDAQIADLEGAASPDVCLEGGPAQPSERDVFDGLEGDMVLDKLQHLSQRLAELRHEIEGTELLVELKDMRIAQLQVLASADDALDTARETDLALEELRVGQIQEQIERFEQAEIGGRTSESMGPSLDTEGTSSPVSSTETPIIVHEEDNSATADSQALALESESGDQTSQV